MKRITNNRRQYTTRASLPKRNKSLDSADTRSSSSRGEFNVDKRGYFIWNQNEGRKKI
jgi:hypothetical protein